MTTVINLKKDHFTGAQQIVVEARSATLVGGPHDGQTFGPDEATPTTANDSLAWLACPMRQTVAAACLAANGLASDKTVKEFISR